MKLSGAMVRKLAQKYSANGLIDLRDRGNDLTLEADKPGNAVLLFIAPGQ